MHRTRDNIWRASRWRNRQQGSRKCCGAYNRNKRGSSTIYEYQLHCNSSMKKLLTLISWLVLVPSAWCQFTTVSGISKDPSGNVYANAQIGASFVPPTNAVTQPLLSGSTFQTEIVGAQADSFGAFSLRLADNSQIVCGPFAGCGQWKFSIQSQTCSGQHSSFTATITISGATMVITSQLQAAAAPLPACLVPVV